MVIRTDLSSLNESYRSAGSGYAGALEEGTYEARLVSAEITLSKNQNLQVRWILEADMPSGQIGTTMKFSPLVERSLPYLKIDLKTLGINVDDLNKLYKVLPGLAGTMIRIDVDYDFPNGFPKVSFLEKLQDPWFQGI